MNFNELKTAYLNGKLYFTTDNIINFANLDLINLYVEEQLPEIDCNSVKIYDYDSSIVNFNIFFQKIKVKNSLVINKSIIIFHENTLIPKLDNLECYDCNIYFNNYNALSVNNIRFYNCNIFNNNNSNLECKVLTLHNTFLKNSSNIFNVSSLDTLEIKFNTTNCIDFSQYNFSSIRKLVIREINDKTNLSKITNVKLLTFLHDSLSDKKSICNLPKCEEIQILDQINLENYHKFKLLEICLDTPINSNCIHNIINSIFIRGFFRYLKKDEDLYKLVSNKLPKYYLNIIDNYD